MPKVLHNYVRFTLRILIPSMVAVYVMSCATIVSPTGGPKDITPPKLVYSEPRNLSTNFSGNKLILNFNEYVSLKTPEKYLLISPPLAPLPEIKVKGHSVVIKIEDSLRSNTTYNFYLGNAIVDLTEDNPVRNFNFAFSTGPQIDSLSLSGNVTEAFTRMPVKGALVMLYNDFTDSLPMKQIPTYVSRTNDDGKFMFNSLAAGKYRAVALLDGNNDYKYDLPTELIGFNADSVQPYYIPESQKDTVSSPKDSLKIANPAMLSLNLFPEPDSTQRILKSVMVSKDRLAVFFRYPTKSPSFRVINLPDSLPWSLREWTNNNDTLNAWLLNKPDTLKLEIADRGLVIDTINMSTSMKVVGKPRTTTTETKLKFTNSAMGGKLEYGKPFILTYSNPVKSYIPDSLKLKIIAGKDTSFVKPVVQFTDSIHRHLKINYKWDANSRYDLYLPKGSFTDIYSDICDSTHILFGMRPVDEYGTFSVRINRKDNTYPVIIQLLTDKGAVVDQRIVTTGKDADFGLLPPATYGLKAILDRNANSRWDTGKFLKKIQPETVLIHPKKFEVRTNWELEETWDL